MAYQDVGAFSEGEEMMPGRQASNQPGIVMGGEGPAAPSNSLWSGGVFSVGVLSQGEAREGVVFGHFEAWLAQGGLGWARRGRTMTTTKNERLEGGQQEEIFCLLLLQKAQKHCKYT